MSLKDLFNGLIRATQADGPSSTKLVYLTNGILCAYAAFVGTLGAISVYLVYRVADATFCGFLTALWGISIGFAAGAKKHAAEMTKEITTAQNQDPK